MLTRFAQTLEVMAPPSTTINRLSFPVLPEFRGRPVRAIEFHVNQNVPYSPLGNAVTAASSGLRSGFLQLFVERGGERGYYIQIPLVKLTRTHFRTAAVSSLPDLDIDPVLVDWEKSTIEFPGGFSSSGPGGANTFLFTIHHN